MTFPPSDKSMEGVLKDTRERLMLVERRLILESGGGGSGGGGGGATYQALAGLVMAWDSNTIPSGWLLCDGSLVSRRAYPQLFAAIGTTHGTGDGSTTFPLPDYRGRALVGRDPAQTEFDVLGETGGEKAHTLTIAELPVHDHTVLFAADSTVVSNNIYAAQTAPITQRIQKNGPYAGQGPAGAGLSGDRGGGAAHNNLQPYAVANWIISTGSGVAGGGSTVPALPDPVTVASGVQHSITSAAATWADVPSVAAVTMTLSYPMWVRADYRGQFAPVDTGTYPMAGVAATGALNLIPETDQATGYSAAFGLTPFALAAGGSNVPFSGSKVILLPAGTTVLKMQMRRSTATNTPVIAYPTMTITPLSWVGASGTTQSMSKGTAAQRDAVYGVPTTDPARVALANQQIEWFNTDKGWTEVYYAPTGIAGLTARGVLAGIPSGWYPVAGTLLVALRDKNGAFEPCPVGGAEPVLQLTPTNIGGFTIDGNSGIRVPIAGYYELIGHIYFSGAAMALAQIRFTRNGADVGTVPFASGGSTDLTIGRTLQPTALVANDRMAMLGLPATASNFYGAGARTTCFSVRYLGPPLANG